MIENVYWSWCKTLFILHRFEWDLEYLERFSKKILKYQILWKFVQWEPELFHAEIQTDGHDEANSRSSQFCELA
jgi:hypothetical protein